MASTRSRIRGREHARPSGSGVAAEHANLIYTVAIVGIVITVGVLTLTSIGHVIDAATQHFMLFYAGVFALIALCTSVGLGLVSTDRMFLNPGQRVFIQSAHRAASFGAVAFLIIHIVTEILAQRSHVIDAVVPFLSPFKTFYIGIGTIASDLIILLVITGIFRGRFTAAGKAWRWRAIHYTSYAALVLGVWHGLLGGRPGKPYVDWSYGFVVAFALVGVGIRILSDSLHPKEMLSAPAVDKHASSASAPLRAAAMIAQYGATMRGGKSILGASTGVQPALAAPMGGTVMAALPAGEAVAERPQPYYEPGYEGPPRYMGAPRDTGPTPRFATGPISRPVTGPVPRAATGAMPRVPTGPMRRPPSATGPVPRAGSGPIPRDATGPVPRAMTGPYPAAPAAPQTWTGPLPRATGAMPQFDDGWGPGPVPGPVRPGPAGPPPRGGTGPAPAWGDPRQRPASGPMPQHGMPPEYEGLLEASHDGGRYPEQPPWEGYLPESDPGFGYREPGPGMPGYQGSREQRYGGDRY